jgi:hypothetical protein
MNADMQFDWPIKDGYFIPFAVSTPQSQDGLILKSFYENLEIKGSLYLRGSLLEQAQPFEQSDIDLIYLYDENQGIDQIPRYQTMNRPFDAQILSVQRLFEDQYFIYSALLMCRSLLIAGPSYPLMPIKADFQFAWQHWIKYSPLLLCNQIECHHKQAVAIFKQLVRSFGVISFLQDQRFSRDINDCLSFASSENTLIAQQLFDLRHKIEQHQAVRFKISEIQSYLKFKFQEVYHLYQSTNP